MIASAMASGVGLICILNIAFLGSWKKISEKRGLALLITVNLADEFMISFFL